VTGTEGRQKKKKRNTREKIQKLGLIKRRPERGQRTENGQTLSNAIPPQKEGETGSNKARAEAKYYLSVCGLCLSKGEGVKLTK